MCRKKYVAPASEAVGVTLATVVAGSVVPTGTTGPGNKDASETPWKEIIPLLAVLVSVEENSQAMIGKYFIFHL